MLQVPEGMQEDEVDSDVYGTASDFFSLLFAELSTENKNRSGRRRLRCPPLTLCNPHCTAGIQQHMGQGVVVVIILHVETNLRNQPGFG